MSQATIITAAWNAETTIARSIHSALAQADVASEVIVVDDASPDQTAQRAAEEGAQVLRMATNGGPAAARNLALEAAQGTWVAVLDADDTMTPDRLRKMIDLGTEMGADVVLGNFQKVDETGARLEGRPFLSGAAYAAPQVWDLERYVAGNQVTPGSPALGYLKPLFRRAFLEEQGLRYDPSLRNGEDCHMIYACLAAGARVIFSPAPDYLYTVRRGSISHRVNPAHIDALLAADQVFLERHAGALSPRVQALFASRRVALGKMKDSEEVLQALKARRPMSALSALSQRPAILGRVLEKLLEASLNRARRLLS